MDKKVQTVLAFNFASAAGRLGKKNAAGFDSIEIENHHSFSSVSKTYVQKQTLDLQINGKQFLKQEKRETVKRTHTSAIKKVPRVSQGKR